MSAKASAAEAEAEASEVLDLNADAVAVDNQEQVEGTAAYKKNPMGEEAAAGPPLISAGKSLNVEMNPLEGEGRCAAEAEGTYAAVPTAGRLFTARREASEGTGAGIGFQDGKSNRLFDLSVCQNREPEIIDGKAGDAVDRTDECENENAIFFKVEDKTIEGNTGSDGKVEDAADDVDGLTKGNIIVSKAENKSVEGCTESAGCGFYDEVNHVVPGSSGANLDVPLGSEVRTVKLQATDKSDDVNVSDRVKLDGSENMCPGVENTLLTGEAIEAHAVGYPTSVVEVNPLPISQETDDHSCDRLSKGDVSSEHPDDMGLELRGAERVLDVSLVNKSDDAPSNKEDNLEADAESLLLTNGNLNGPESSPMSGFNVVAEDHLPESCYLGQDPQAMSKGDTTQVDTSLQSAHGSTETGIVLPGVANGQQAILSKRDNGRINKAHLDVGENKVALLDTDDHRKVLNLEELLDKEGKFDKCFIANPDAASKENQQHASYQLPQEDELFSISDLVWGKVKSHPWWPGQILDPAEASDMALKHQKRDNFLVGYFGDKTFAWCEEAKLKPFQTYFSQLESQSTSDAFINAVSDALTEVSRRMELGMSCCCVSEEVISNLKMQNIENAGIQEGTLCSSVDSYSCAASFEPNNFVEYVKLLALYPYGAMDKLGLVIAKSQMTAFTRLRSQNEFPAVVTEHRVSEKDAVSLPPFLKKRPHKSFDEHSSPSSKSEEILSDTSAGKRQKKSQSNMLHRHDIPEHGRKQKSLSELMDDKSYSDLENGDEVYSEIEKSFAYSSGKKIKMDDTESPLTGKSKRKRLDALGDVEKKTAMSDRTFKVGECISRIASKMTGSHSIIKCNGESAKKDNAEKADQDNCEVFDVSLYTPEDTQKKQRGILKNHSTPEEMLSQLCVAAKDPMKGYSFLSAIICFFTEVRELRDSGSMLDKRFEKIKKKRGRKKKSEFLDDSQCKLVEVPSPSTSTLDEKLSKQIGSRRGRKKKIEHTIELEIDSTESSTPDYMADSYWTDRIVCGTPEEKSQSSRRKRKKEILIHSSQRKSRPMLESLPLSKILEVAHHLRIGAVSPTGNRDPAVEKQSTFYGEKCLEEIAPTALILSFNEPGALPSETNLIRIFSRYGPLKETETEVVRETKSAKVVFKKRSDAEIAFRSAGKYCFFGPALVSFCLRTLSSTSAASPRMIYDADARKDAIMEDVLKTPAQGEANKLVHKEICKSAQEEVKESGQVAMEEFAQEKVNELIYDNMKGLRPEEASGLSKQEPEELARVGMEEATEDKVMEVACKSGPEEEEKSGEDETEFIPEKANEFAQDKVKLFAQVNMGDLSQKRKTKEESKELAQADMKESAEGEITEVAKEEMEYSAQDKTEELIYEKSELIQAEVDESIQEEVETLVQGEIKSITQGMVKDLCQAEPQEMACEGIAKSIQAGTKESTQERRGLSAIEVTDVAEEEMEDLTQHEVKEFTLGEPAGLVQSELDESMEEKEEEFIQVEVKNATQDRVRTLGQAEGLELSCQEADKFAQAEIGES